MSFPISIYDRRAAELALTKVPVDGLSSMATGQLLNLAMNGDGFDIHKREWIC